MKNVAVRITATCETCDGDGTVYDPMNWGWAEVLEATKDLDGEGWVEWLGEHKGLLPGEEPPEEGPCPECSGSGRTGTEVSLRRLDALMKEAKKDA